ncbi:MAG: dATP/dGTP pyrophosphohydrolase domain-containing protein [Pseudomonadota bacterium]
MKRIYLSGPMTGLPDFNFPAFNAEAARLRSLGYDVVNPAELNPDFETPYDECLRVDLKALLDCDTIAMLDGWMDSNGAHLEMHIAHRVGIRVIEARRIDDNTLHAGQLDLVAHLHRQRAFSMRTFGPGARTDGVVDHIRKELIEIEGKPDDVTEWIDVVLLALDGAWRAGHSPEAIAAALLAKQEKNERRMWPDWRTAEPGKAIQHVKVSAGETAEA